MGVPEMSQDMSLFEVQRILDVWPSLQDGHILRNLFMKQDAVKNVWLGPGHVFILEGSQLHILSQVSSTDPSNGHFQIGATSDVLDIVQLQPNIMLLVETNGQTKALEYFVSSSHWEQAGKAILPATEGEIASVICFDRNHLLYCVKECGLNDDWCYSVFTLTCNIDKEVLQFSNRVQLLYNCPNLSLYSCRLGVWLIPKTGEVMPSNLMMYWNKQDKFVQSYVWGQYDIKTELKDFKSICRQTANLWSKKTNDISSLVSFNVHPILNDLICLTDSGTVYFIFQKEGGFIKKVFIQLSDFTERYPTPKTWFNSSPSILQLFVLHTYIGVCQLGELRLYDSTTGEFIWESDDLDHPTTRLITPSIPIPMLPVSLWNRSGIYFLRCKRIADHANMFVTSLFPIATNADETTPGDYLDDAEIVAAELCHLWSLDMLASHYTLKMAYALLKDYSVSPNKKPLPPKLLELLTQLSVQNPVLCVALLNQYPIYRNVLVQHLTKFVDSFYHNDSDALKTSLNLQTAPLLKQYLELSQQYDDLLSVSTSPVNCMPSVRDRVKEVLNLSQQTTLSEDLTVQLRADLTSYSFFDPIGTLRGIKDFMKVRTTFIDALQNFKKNIGEYETLNWKSILVSDIAQKIPQTSLKATNNTNNLPIFELMVQLLYSHEPQDLVQFVAFIHEARNLPNTSDSTYARQCHKGYFYQRALDIIPMPTTVSSTHQVHSFCQILLMSERSCAEMKALQILLDHQMWLDAIAMLHQATPSVQCALFHSTLLSLSKGGVLHQHISSIWPLLPKTFSIHSFVDVLKMSCKNQKPNQIYNDSNDTLELQQVIPYILEILSQQNLQ